MDLQLGCEVYKKCEPRSALEIHVLCFEVAAKRGPLCCVPQLEIPVEVLWVYKHKNHNGGAPFFESTNTRANAHTLTVWR